MSCVEAAGDLMYASADIERSILGIISEESTEHHDMLQDSLNADSAAIAAAFDTLDAHLSAFHAEDAAAALCTQLTSCTKRATPCSLRSWHISKAAISPRHTNCIFPATV